MSQRAPTPTPGPWSLIWNDGGLILITGVRNGDRAPIIAAVNGTHEADAIAISLVPELLVAIRTGDLAPAVEALTRAGL